MLHIALLSIGTATTGLSGTVKLLFFAFISFIIWRVLARPGRNLLPPVRHFFLLTFFVSFIYPYFKFMLRLKDNLLLKHDLNYLFIQVFKEFKGSDWADGILCASIFFLFCGIILYAQNIERKASFVQPIDRPLSIEARIGNIIEQNGRNRRAG